MFAADDKMALSNEFNPNKLKKKQEFHRILSVISSNRENSRRPIEVGA